ncbi:DNA-binding protein [Skermania sp. ID1734]|uniref:helix-turn-helix transcriptional regulator n=1 Tax=Skermania sp. ID1734 TaxID=2597516 RepID=UPI00117EEEF7|nr:DNA-binding protein [Skermania sp. ID1734]TSE00672.1 DNA-binding protein [Skermania sp. ID1734]
MTDRRPLATPKEHAAYRGVTEQYLAQERYLGNGPKFIKTGKHVRYRWEDIDAWLAERTVTRTDQVSA